MRGGIVASGIILLVVAAALWVFLSPNSSLWAEIANIGGKQASGVVGGGGAKLPEAQLFTYLAMISGFVGLVILIAGLATSPPQPLVVIGDEPLVVSQPATPTGSVKYCMYCGTPSPTDSVFCRACGREFPPSTTANEPFF